MSEPIKILNQLKKNLKEVLGNRIQKVILFGSWIKNEENEYSDLDVLIVTDKIFSWKEKNIIRDICFDISVDYEILVDSKIISQEEIDTKFWGKHPLITDALKSGVYAD
jgi:predicted nucleotidyltransferase